MAAQVYIDGIEVTSICLDGSATRRLNRPAQATMRIPIDEAIGDVGSRMKVVLDGSLFFHGIVLMIEDQAEEDFGYTTYNATDPLELWRWRPCRDFTGPTPGNLITPTFLERLESGPQIIEEIMLASENPAGIPETAEGPLFVSPGNFAPGGVSLSGAPTNWPTSMADLSSLLISTGELDIVLTPIDSGGNMAQVDCYNGNYGTDLTGFVSFDYATGNHNVRSIRQAVDMSNVVNKLQYFIGPKETLTRYKANITGDDPCLPGNMWGGGVGGGVGGALLGRPYFADPRLGTLRSNSQALYGVRFEFQEFDADVVSKEDPDATPGPAIPCGDPVRTILRKRWQQESWLRAMPRKLVHITPVRISDNMQLPPGVNPVQIGDFDIGDLVSVNAGAILRGGFSGLGQRVYEYTVGWDTEGVYELSEIQTSSDQEGSI